ncbi:MAG: DUF1294 domain-containing protein [Acholeplasmatales bacterium]|nr:DUF1294 domain-containing protein [Acholeplasmatales bacterium]
MEYEKIIIIAYCAVLVLMSLAAFFLFGKDKKMAQKGGGPKRIKEKILLGSCALGGAIGGFFGRIVFHHKTDKKYFSITIYLGVVVQVALLVFLCYVGFTDFGK